MHCVCVCMCDTIRKTAEMNVYVPQLECEKVKGKGVKC